MSFSFNFSMFNSLKRGLDSFIHELPLSVSALTFTIGDLVGQEDPWAPCSIARALRIIHSLSEKGDRGNRLQRIKSIITRAGLLEPAKAFGIIRVCLEKDDFEPLWGLLDSGFDINTCFPDQDHWGVLEMAFHARKYHLAEKLLYKGARFQCRDNKSILKASRLFFLDKIRCLKGSEVSSFVDIALQQGLEIRLLDKKGRFLLTDAIAIQENGVQVWSKLLDAMTTENLQASGNNAVELLHTFADKAADTEENLVFLDQLLDKMPRDIAVWENVKGILPGRLRSHDRIYQRLREWFKVYYTDQALQLGMLISLGGCELEARSLIDTFKQKGLWKEIFFQLIQDPKRGPVIIKKIMCQLEFYRADLEGIIEPDDDAFKQLHDEVMWQLVIFISPQQLRTLMASQQMDLIQLENWEEKDLSELHNKYLKFENPEQIHMYETELKELSPLTVAQGMARGLQDLFVTAFDSLTESQQRIVMAGLGIEDALEFLEKQWLLRINLEPACYAVKEVKTCFIKRLLENHFFIDTDVLEHEILKRVGRISALQLRRDRSYGSKIQSIVTEFFAQYSKVILVKQKIDKLQRFGEGLKKRLDPDDDLYPQVKAFLEKTGRALNLCKDWQQIKMEIDEMSHNLPVSEEALSSVCPISLQPIETPAQISVDGEEGGIYDLAFLEDYLKSCGGKALSPLTRRPFSSEHVVPLSRKRRKVTQ